MASTKSPKPFADIDSAMNAFDAEDLTSSLSDARDEIKTAEIAENFVDMDAALFAAEEQLARALKTIRTVRARLAVSA